MRVGIVGAGSVSGQYDASFRRLPQVEVTAVADVDPARAGRLAAEQPAARALPLAELLRADDVDLVLNLTLPAAHAEVSLAALAAGKHVYSEKPLALSLESGRRILAAAAAAGLRIGCAPDTVLGTGTQTARAAVDAGRIGVPHAATAFMLTPGHERWHPEPEFYYRPGGGPLLDMGPYHITALVHLLGPVAAVQAASTRPRQSRTIGSGPRAGTEFPVSVDTHVSGLLQHVSGALTTFVMSFDTQGGRLPHIEVYGDAGSLSVPDPNTFAGPVELLTSPAGEWAPLPAAAGYLDAGRGYGVADLAIAHRAARPHRAGGELALHVLDVMESLLRAAESGDSVSVNTDCLRPEPVSGLVQLQA